MIRKKSLSFDSDGQILEGKVSLNESDVKELLSDVEKLIESVGKISSKIPPSTPNRNEHLKIIKELKEKIKVSQQRF